MPTFTQLTEMLNKGDLIFINEHDRLCWDYPLTFPILKKFLEAWQKATIKNTNLSKEKIEQLCEEIREVLDIARKVRGISQDEYQNFFERAKNLIKQLPKPLESKMAEQKVAAPIPPERKIEREKIKAADLDLENFSYVLLDALLSQQFTESFGDKKSVELSCPTENIKFTVENSDPPKIVVDDLVNGKKVTLETKETKEAKKRDYIYNQELPSGMGIQWVISISEETTKRKKKSATATETKSKPANIKCCLRRKMIAMKDYEVILSRDGSAHDPKPWIFSQSGDITPQTQGIKLHIATSDLEIVMKKLIQLGFLVKNVPADRISTLKQSATQAGKYTTIYICQNPDWTVAEYARQLNRLFYELANEHVTPLSEIPTDSYIAGSGGICYSRNDLACGLFYYPPDGKPQLLALVDANNLEETLEKIARSPLATTGTFRLLPAYLSLSEGPNANFSRIGYQEEGTWDIDGRMIEPCGKLTLPGKQSSHAGGAFPPEMTRDPSQLKPNLNDPWMRLLYPKKKSEKLTLPDLVNHCKKCQVLHASYSLPSETAARTETKTVRVEHEPNIFLAALAECRKHELRVTLSPAYLSSTQLPASLYAHPGTHPVPGVSIADMPAVTATPQKQKKT